MNTPQQPDRDEQLRRFLVREYTQMPALRLTGAQAQRLLGIEAARCRALLDALVDARVLRRLGDGRYASTTGEAPSRPAPRPTMATAHPTRRHKGSSAA